MAITKYGEKLGSACHCWRRVSSKAHNPWLAADEKSLKNDSFQENPLEKKIPFSYIPVVSAIKRPKLTGPDVFAIGFSKANVFHKFWLANGAAKLWVSVHVNVSTNNGITSDLPGFKTNGDWQAQLSNNELDKKLDLQITWKENDDCGWWIFWRTRALLESILSENHNPRYWSWVNAVSTPACAR